MVRRLLMVLAITVFNNMPFFQIVSLVILSMATMVATLHGNAFLSKRKNVLEFINELTVYTCMWSSINF